VLPRLAAVLSAWGMMTTDLRCEMVRTHIAGAHQASAASLRRLFAQMEAEGKRRLRPAFKGVVRTHRALDMRYGEQIFEIGVFIGRRGSSRVRSEFPRWLSGSPAA